jgi:hypothetical protein
MNEFLIRLYRIEKVKDVIPNAFDNQNINKDYLGNQDYLYGSILNEMDTPYKRDSDVNISQPDKIIYVRQLFISIY